MVQTMTEGFKHTEVGVIPSDWNSTSIGKFSKLINGRAYSIHEWETQGIPVIRLQNLTGRGDKYYYSNLKLPEKQYCNFGDLLFMWSATFGPVIWRGEKAIYHYHIWKIETDEDHLNKSFLYHILEDLTERVKKNATNGGTMLHLTKSGMELIQIPLPPTLAEQTAIATALNDADALIQKLEQLISKKRHLKTGAMQELLRPKEGWEVKILHELADNKKELFDDGDWIEAEHITDNGIRIIQTGNIGIGCYVEKENKKYIFEDSFYKLKCKQLIEGDLLICRLAEPAGRACVLPNIGESRIVTSVDVTIFRPRPEVANRVFLANLFSTSDWFTKVIERVGGTTHKRISRSSLGKILISIPKIDEQNHIATILSDMDDEIQALEKQLEQYKRVKQGMMQSLLTGKIRLV